MDSDTINTSLIYGYTQFLDQTKKSDDKSRAPLLTLRLITLIIIVALMTLHLRSMRVFRWEHSVTGGLLVTYIISMLGLALCAGANHCGGLALQVRSRFINFTYQIWLRVTPFKELFLNRTEMEYKMF